MTKPLQEPTFLILSALLSGPLHGYALLTAIQDETGGRVRLRVGTMYAALERLRIEGLVEVYAEETVNGRLRRTYRVTSAGSQTVSAEAERMVALARRVQARLRDRSRAPLGAEATR